MLGVKVHPPLSEETCEPLAFISSLLLLLLFFFILLLLLLLLLFSFCVSVALLFLEPLRKRRLCVCLDSIRLLTQVFFLFWWKLMTFSRVSIRFWSINVIVCVNYLKLARHLQQIEEKLPICVGFVQANSCHCWLILPPMAQNCQFMLRLSIKSLPLILKFT